jgi:hypothetical protein
MTGSVGDARAVAALAEAIDSALDTWDTGSVPRWAAGDPDRKGLAEAVVSLLSQHGYGLSPLEPAQPGDPGYGLAISDGPAVDRAE